MRLKMLKNFLFMKLDWAIAGIHTLSPHPGCGLQHPEHARAASAELQKRWSLPLLFGARNEESEIKHQKFLFQNNCLKKSVFRTHTGTGTDIHLIRIRPNCFLTLPGINIQYNHFIDYNIKIFPSKDVN